MASQWDSRELAAVRILWIDREKQAGRRVGIPRIDGFTSRYVVRQRELVAPALLVDGRQRRFPANT